jgi:hypothetical protein
MIVNFASLPGGSPSVYTHPVIHWRGGSLSDRAETSEGGRINIILLRKRGKTRKN